MSSEENQTSTENHPLEMDVLFVGYSCVGKTALISRFTTGDFPETNATIAPNYLKKQITIGSRIINMNVWDTPSQEHFRETNILFYRRANVFVIIFSVDNRNSFDDVKSCFEEVVSHSPDSIIFLCGNCCDVENREVSFEDGMDKAKELGKDVEYFETSAMSGKGVDAMFERIAEKWLTTEQNKTSDAPPKKGCIIA